MKKMVLHSVTEFLTKLNSSHRISVLVQKRRVDADAHFTRDNEHNSTAYTRLGRESDFVSKLTAVIVHSTAVHQ